MEEIILDVVTADACAFYSKWFNALYEEVSKYESVKVYVNRGTLLDNVLEFTAFSEEDNPDFFKGIRRERTILVTTTKLEVNNNQDTFYANDFFYLDDDLTFGRSICSNESYTEHIYKVLFWSELLSKNKVVVSLLKKFLEEYQVIVQAKEKIMKIKHDEELDNWKIKYGYSASTKSS